ncbi:MAG: DMT family transporter [Proteobacteria bacterium]|nr:DMT family transporter [Pseudomonadota bacterium]
MTGALLSFSAMAVAFRSLGTLLSIFELLSIRNALGLVIVVAIAAARGAIGTMIVPQRFGLHVVRNGVHFGAQYLWAWSLMLLPLATVFALEFTAPIWTALLAVPLLGERITRSRAGAILLGFVGVLIILRPGFESFRPASLIVLVAAIGFTVTSITTKMLVSRVSTYAIIFWMNALQLPIALSGSDPTFPSRLGLEHIPAVVAIGVAGLTAHYCLANAFRSGDASIVVSIDFLRIPLIAVVGWWVYQEGLDLPVFVGAAIILASVVWCLRGETLRLAPPKTFVR